MDEKEHTFLNLVFERRALDEQYLKALAKLKRKFAKDVKVWAEKAQKQFGG